MNEKKQTKQRFSNEDDLVLIKEAVAQNPYNDSKKWNNVTAKLFELNSKTFTARAVRDRANKLLEPLEKKEVTKIRKEGTEEMFINKIMELQKLHTFKEGRNKKRKMKVKSEQTSAGVKISERVTSAEDIKDASCINPLPSTSRDFRNSLVPQYSESNGYSCDVEPPLITDSDSSSDWYDNPTNESPVEPTHHHEDVDGAKKKSPFRNSIQERSMALEERRLDLDKERLEIDKRILEVKKEKLAIENRRLQLEEEKFHRRCTASRVTEIIK